MKTYELKIEACHTDSEQIYRSKGHHSTEDFLAALQDYGIDVTRFTVPQLVYVKTTPAANNSGYSCWYSIVDKSVRGAYPATYVGEYGQVYNKEVISRLKEEQNEKQI